MISKKDVSNFGWLDNSLQVGVSQFLHESTKVAEHRVFGSWGEFYDEFLAAPPVLTPSNIQQDLLPDKRRPLPNTWRGFSIARYASNHRSTENLQVIYAITYDFDSFEGTFDELVAKLRRPLYACIVHTTPSNGCGGRLHARAIFPLATPCVGSRVTDWEATYDKLAEYLESVGCGERDWKAGDAPHFWYIPAQYPGADYRVTILDGHFLPLESAKPGYARPKRQRERAVTEPAEKGPPVQVILPPAQRLPTEEQAYLGQAWIDRKVAEYKALPERGGARSDWIERYAQAFGGNFAEGDFHPRLSEQQICHTFVSAICSGKHSRGWDKEYAFWMKGWEMGKARPISNPGLAQVRAERKEKKSRKQGIGTLSHQPERGPTKEQMKFKGPWGDEFELLPSSDGKTRRCEENCRRLVAAYYGDRVCFDQFTNSTVILRPDGKYDQFIADEERISVNQWIAESSPTRDWPDVSPKTFASLAIKCGSANVINVERERLKRTSSKGAIPLEDIATEILGAEDTPVNRAAVMYHLMSTVARATSLGPTDIQYFLCLQGHPHFGKSSYGKILGAERWSSQIGEVLWEARFYNKHKGKTCVEFPEAVALVKTGVEECKGGFTDAWNQYDQKHRTESFSEIRRFTPFITCNRPVKAMQDRRFVRVIVGVVPEKCEYNNKRIQFHQEKWIQSVRATESLAFEMVESGFEWWKLLDPFADELRASRREIEDEPVMLPKVEKHMINPKNHGKSTSRIMEDLEMPVIQRSKLFYQVQEALEVNFKYGKRTLRGVDVYGWWPKQK